MVVVTINKQEIIDRIKQHNLPVDDYVVFGSGPLAAAGIRPAADIDLVVAPQLFDQMRKSGWQQAEGLRGEPRLTYGDFEVFMEWNFGGYCPTLSELQESADVIDGIPFVNLREVNKWKQVCGRPKDIADINLINLYLQR